MSPRTRRNTIQPVISRIFQESGGFPLSISQIVQQVFIEVPQEEIGGQTPDATIRSIVYRMMERGEVEKVEYGRYRWIGEEGIQ